MNRSHARTLVTAAMAFAMSNAVHAGAFTFGDNNANVVAHPQNAQAGGQPAPQITVCLDPNAQPADGGNPETAIRNTVATYNRMAGITGNVKSAAASGVASGVDFESVMLHELGHCMGIDHTVLGPSEVGCSLGNGGTCNSHPSVFATLANDGDNGAYDVSNGADGVRASRDDGRGDDVNRHWYMRGVNNPFAQPPAVVDRNTYAVSTNYLPGTHTAVEAATSHAPCRQPTADTDNLPGRVANTQNTMFPVICGNNALRDLAPDDVATLRIARAGFDGTQGTADDYAPVLSYVGKTTNCDVVVRFSGGGLGFCSVTASVQGTNAVLTSGTITVGQTTSINWHFNQTDTSNPPRANLSLSLSVSPASADLGDTLVYEATVANAGPAAATDVTVRFTLPAGLTFEGSDTSGWTCEQDGAAALCTRAAALASGANASVQVRADIPTDYAGPTALTASATADSALDDPAPGDNTDGVTSQVSLLLDRIFGDGFE